MRSAARRVPIAQAWRVADRVKTNEKTAMRGFMNMGIPSWFRKKLSVKVRDCDLHSPAIAGYRRHTGTSASAGQSGDPAHLYLRVMRSRPHRLMFAPHECSCRQGHKNLEGLRVKALSFTHSRIHQHRKFQDADQDVTGLLLRCDIPTDLHHARQT